MLILTGDNDLVCYPKAMVPAAAPSRRAACDNYGRKKASAEGGCSGLIITENFRSPKRAIDYVALRSDETYLGFASSLASKGRNLNRGAYDGIHRLVTH